MQDLFREIDHTGDLAIVVSAAEKAGLFARAGLALFALLVEPAGVARSQRRRLHVRAADGEELLHDWLSQLLSDFYAEGFIGAAIEAHLPDDENLEAEIAGDVLDPSRHVVLREIKAVTYHALSLRRVGEGWEARITFDV